MIKPTITVETIYEAISLDWGVAHKSTSLSTSSFRWNRIEDMLSGMWSLANWSRGIEDLDNTEVLDEIAWLQELVSCIRYL